MSRRPANSTVVRKDREHFAGRRRGSRHRVVMSVTCAGASGRYAARTIELSRTGAVLEVRDDGFGPESKSNLLEFSKRVADEFSGGMRIGFAEPKLSLAARVIRTMRHPTAATLLIASEFLVALTDPQCRMLGLPTEERAGI